MGRIDELRVKIFSDGANVGDFKRFRDIPYIKGYTTNPTLMKKAGVTDYEGFIREVLPIVNGRPISLEVISDEFADMRKQAIKLSGFGDNVYVKIPITNTAGESSIPLVGDLTHSGVKVNVTALLALEQVEKAAKVLTDGEPAIVSVFAGRVADTGVDPVPLMKEARGLLIDCPKTELLWASPRELLNIFDAEEAGCHIIAVLPEILDKLHLTGYDLKEFSLDTVKMFYDDAVKSGLSLD